jgi:hypothetical protein
MLVFHTNFCKATFSSSSCLLAITELALWGEGVFLITCGNMLRQLSAFGNRRENDKNKHVITCYMVKRGGKEVITVEIFKQTYDTMKANAAKKRWNTKDYINTVLMEALEKDKFLQTFAPSLSKVGFEDNVLFIRDAKQGKTVEIYLKDRTLYCNTCESKDCLHIHYALALPEVAKLYLHKSKK